MPRPLILVLALLLPTVLAACESRRPAPPLLLMTSKAVAAEVRPAGAPPAGSAAVGAPVGATRPTLLFFINPAGRPCQMQKDILDNLGSTLTDVAALELVSVEDPAGQQKFATYGIRALPSLILVNPEGREQHRFTPGIHEGAEVIAALKK